METQQIRDYGLPALFGTEDQVLKAKGIRDQLISSKKITLELATIIELASTWLDIRLYDDGMLNRFKAKLDSIIKANKRALEEKGEKDKKQWRMVAVNNQNIETQAKSSFLIKLPKSSDYSGMLFWFPASLVKEGRHSGEVLIRFNGDFEFIAKKYGSGQWNKSDVISERKITPDELEKLFGGRIDDDKSLKKYEAPEEEFKHIPARIEPVKIEADERLKR